MNPVADLTIEALGRATVATLPTYCKALSVACASEAPPYGTRRYGDIYRSVASDPEWLAVSIITSAEREGDGAGRLWSLAACTEDKEIAMRVKQHAIDESRHARWYISVLDIVFPGAVDDSLRPHIAAIAPRYSAKMAPAPVQGSPYAHAITIDDLVQMNIAEIRTAINQRLQRPVLMAFCRPSERQTLDRLLGRLLRDEIRHVTYSARLIERLAASAGEETVIELMTLRVRDFNEITCSEVEDKVFPLHCSREECRQAAVCVPASALN